MKHLGKDCYAAYTYSLREGSALPRVRAKLAAGDLFYIPTAQYRLVPGIITRHILFSLSLPTLYSKSPFCSCSATIPSRASSRASVRQA